MRLCQKVSTSVPSLSHMARPHIVRGWPTWFFPRLCPAFPAAGGGTGVLRQDADVPFPFLSLPPSHPRPPQGRMLHVLPSTIKKEASEDTDTSGSSSYKKKKESKDKANSSRSLPATSLWAPPLQLPGCSGPLGWVRPLAMTLPSPAFLICLMGGNPSGALLFWCCKN